MTKIFSKGKMREKGTGVGKSSNSTYSSYYDRKNEYEKAIIPATSKGGFI